MFATSCTWRRVALTAAATLLFATFAEAGDARPFGTHYSNTQNRGGYTPAPVYRMPAPAVRIVEPAPVVVAPRTTIATAVVAAPAVNPATAEQIPVCTCCEVPN